MTIGKSAPRKEGHNKISGQSQYIDDCPFPDLWHGVTVRSSVARGRIKAIHFGNESPWGEICVVSAKDIPGKNIVALLETDQPFLAESRVEHPEEPILLLAHPDRGVLEKARRDIRIEYAAQLPELDFERSTTTFKSYRVEKGDVDAIWKKDGVIIVEGEYRTGAQEQLYLETNGMVARAGTTGVTVWGSMQCPYYVHKALKTLFDHSDSEIRIIQTETGGGFGGKEEYPSIIAGHAALLSRKCGHPVKIVYSRAEDLAATTKRHPSRTRHKTAVSCDGRLQAMAIDFLIDGGAYTTLSPVVLSRGTIHAAGPYRCDNVRIDSRAVKTNTPPHGAFRGFGAPQSLFALERHMDQIAKALGLAPETIRQRNFLKKGDRTATGQIIDQDIDMAGLLKKALVATQWSQKRRRFQTHNTRSRIKKGIGLASFFHGAGFTGSGEKLLESSVAIEANREGKLQILTANTEIGQGTNTILAQIAADALRIPYDWVAVAQPDTARVPDSGPTVASRTCMIVGKLVQQAAEDLGKKIGHTRKDSSTSFQKKLTKYCLAHGPVKATAQYRQPKHIRWDDEHYRGDAYGAYAWAVYVAEVSVDTVTYAIRVDDFYAIQEIGRVVNPCLAKGQIIGGIVQGIGWALFEKVVWQNGRMANNSLTNYVIPTTLDTPDIRVRFEEQPYAAGPNGAKGIGELPLDGPAPAIVNAVENAIGKSIHQIPLMPEALLTALDETP